MSVFSPTLKIPTECTVASRIGRAAKWPPLIRRRHVAEEEGPGDDVALDVLKRDVVGLVVGEGPIRRKLNRAALDVAVRAVGGILHRTAVVVAERPIRAVLDRRAVEVAQRPVARVLDGPVGADVAEGPVGAVLHGPVARDVGDGAVARVLDGNFAGGEGRGRRGRER